jgi:simple sugar transport system permease protein
LSAALTAVGGLQGTGARRGRRPDPDHRVAHPGHPPLIAAGWRLAGVPHRLFNIGAQGQLIVGAVLAAWSASRGTCRRLHLLVAVLAGLVGGAIWGGIVGLLKARPARTR